MEMGGAGFRNPSPPLWLMLSFLSASFFNALRSIKSYVLQGAAWSNELRTAHDLPGGKIPGSIFSNQKSLKSLKCES